MKKHKNPLNIHFPFTLSFRRSLQRKFTNEKKQKTFFSWSLSFRFYSRKNQTTNITQLPVSYLPSFLKKLTIFGNSDVIITSTKKKEKNIRKFVIIFYELGFATTTQVFIFSSKVMTYQHTHIYTNTQLYIQETNRQISYEKKTHFNVRVKFNCPKKTLCSAKKSLEVRTFLYC